MNMHHQRHPPIPLPFLIELRTEKAISVFHTIGGRDVLRLCVERGGHFAEDGSNEMLVGGWWLVLNEKECKQGLEG
jgi:hypothetical protein